MTTSVELHATFGHLVYNAIQAIFQHLFIFPFLQFTQWHWFTFINGLL